MEKIKSLLFTILVLGAIYGGFYLIPINKGKKVKEAYDIPVITEEEQL